MQAVPKYKKIMQNSYTILNKPISRITPDMQSCAQRKKTMGPDLHENWTEFDMLLFLAGSFFKTWKSNEGKL